MASYRLSVKHIARGQGQSATAAAAYRAGEKVRHEELACPPIKTTRHQEALDRGEISARFRNQLENKGVSLSDNAAVEKLENRWEITDGKKSYTVRESMTGKKNPKPQLSIYENGSHDYSSRKEVVDTQIFTPEGAQEWTKNRSDLHTTIEAADTHKNAWVAKEVQVSLPRELDLQQNKTLIQEFVEENFTSRGMIADVAIHNDENNHNPHAHILLTTREIEGNGFATTKNREWDKRNTVLLKEWREDWRTKQNEHLEQAGSSERVDHRTLEAQNIDRKPQIHMGKHAWHSEQNGEQTIRGDRNRVIKLGNQRKQEQHIQAIQRPKEKMEAVQLPSQNQLVRSGERSEQKHTNPQLEKRGFMQRIAGMLRKRGEISQTYQQPTEQKKAVVPVANVPSNRLNRIQAFFQKFSPDGKKGKIIAMSRLARIKQELGDTAKEQATQAKDDINKEVFSKDVNPEITAMGEAAEGMVKELFKKDNVVEMKDLPGRRLASLREKSGVRAAQGNTRQQQKSEVKQEAKQEQKDRPRRSEVFEKHAKTRHVEQQQQREKVKNDKERER